MKGIPGAKSVAYVLGAIASIAAILWAESTLWLSVKALRTRADTVNSDQFHLSDHFKAQLQELNAHFLQDRLNPTATNRSEILREIQSMQQWLLDHSAPTSNLPHSKALAEARSIFAQLATHWQATPVSPAPTPAPSEWRLLNEPLMSELLGLAEKLNQIEKSELSQFMTGTQESMDAMYRRLVLSSLVLLIMGATLGLLAYHGIIAPLRSRLAQSQHIIERQEKLSSLGVLAAGVAHEIRNPLTSIKARLFTQQSLLDNHSEALEDNVFITEEISRLEKIVADFLAFARPSEPRRIRLKPSQTIRELDGLFRPALTKANIQLHTDFAQDPEVEADPGQLKQVLINLVQNAAESIGRDGTITLRTRIQTRRRMSQSSTAALIEVVDTGKGIPPEARRRLFDPFFTTKPSGTGLGLSIAARILEKHGGSLEYETELQRGTTFRLILPAVS